MRLHHLEEEINGMDEELKSLLHSVQPKPEDYRYGSIAFMDEQGEMVAAFRGEIFRPDRKDRAQRCIKVMMKDLGGGTAIRDQDPGGVSDSL